MANLRERTQAVIDERLAQRSWERHIEAELPNPGGITDEDIYQSVARNCPWDLSLEEMDRYERESGRYSL